MNSNLSDYISYLRSLSQPSIHIGNQYTEDTYLRHCLSYFLPKAILSSIEPLLKSIGEKTSLEYLKNAKDSERNPPKLEQFSSTGERIDEIHTAQGWKNHHKIASRDGIVALAYESDDNKLSLGEYRRFIQATILYLYQPSSGLYGCPLAMTDGAAAVIKTILEGNIDEKRRKKLEFAFKNLTSRNEEEFWTSGQWMTEKRGGSDVSNSTETIAIKYKDNKYKLYGYKWFSSATECDMSLALARIINYDPNKQLKYEDIKKIPVSLFFLKTRSTKTKQLNNIEIIKMKDKLGTRQLPTAELLLKGTKATLISPEGKGVKSISVMLNITRVYNSASSVSTIRRGLALLRDYGDRRIVFGKKLNELPLHQQTIADMEITFRGNLVFYLKVIELLSKSEAKKATKEELMLLRLFTPILKLFTAKDSMRVISECVEGFGALGYIETSFIPVLLRDAQVLTIWEGTTNVLSYDVFRVLINDGLESINIFIKFFGTIMYHSIVTEGKYEDDIVIRQTFIKLVTNYHELINDMRKIAEKKENRGYNLRNLSFGIAKITISSLLLDFWIKSGRNQDKETFIRWVNKNNLYETNNDKPDETRKFALDLDSNNKLRGVGDIDEKGNIRPKF